MVCCLFGSSEFVLVNFIFLCFVFSPKNEFSLLDFHTDCVLLFSGTNWVTTRQQSDKFK